MKENLSERINNLAVSQTLAMAAKARELKNEGKDVIGLSLGEPDFNTPNYIKQAAVNAINEDYNSYTPVDGYVDLKNAIITKFKRPLHEMGPLRAQPNCKRVQVDPSCGLCP